MAFVDVTDPNYKPEGEAGGSGFVDVTDPNYTPPPPRGAVAEIGTGIKRGALVGLPQMVGQALQYTSSKGQPIYEMGKGIAGRAEARGAAPDLTMQPEEHGAVTNALAAGGEILPSMLAPAALAAGTIAALPAAMPALASTAIVAGATAVPFAAQAGQTTLEKGEKAGVPEGEALTAARLNVGLNFGAQMAQGMIGGQLLGKIPTLFGNVVRKEGTELAAKTMAEMSGRAGILKPFAKSLALSAGEAVAVGGAQAAGTAAIERAYGMEAPTPWDAAVDMAPAMLGLSALMAPLGLAGRAIRANSLAKRAEALGNKDTAPQIRDQLATQYFAELNKVDPEAARVFAKNAELAIQNKLPMEVDAGLFQQGAVTVPKPPEAPRPLQGMLALPAPYDFVAGEGGVGRDADAVRAAAPEPAGPQRLLPPPEARPQIGNDIKMPGEILVTPEAQAARQAADANAARIYEQRAAAENRRNAEEVHGQVIAELEAAGVEPVRGMSFPAFREAMAKEAKKTGLKASDLTARDYEAMWQQHQDDVRAANFTKAQQYAFQLAESTRTKIPTSAGEKPRSALALALEDALKFKQLDDAFKDREASAAAAKEAELTAIQNIAKGEQLATAAEQGAVPPTTTVPSPAAKLVLELRAVKPEGQAMPPKLMKELTKTVEGKKSLEEQLVAVRELRDAKNPESASYEMLDKLHAKLGGENADQKPGAVESVGGEPPGAAAQVAEGKSRPILEAAKAREEGAAKKGDGESAALKQARKDFAEFEPLTDSGKEPYAGAKKWNGMWESKDGQHVAFPTGGIGFRTVSKAEATFLEKHGFGGSHLDHYGALAYEAVKRGESTDAIRSKLEKTELPLLGNDPKILEHFDTLVQEAKAEGVTAAAEKRGGGRTKGTTDDRHTIGPPNEPAELLPYTRTLSQAREGAGGIFGEKQWWQDLAWAVRNAETKIGKEMLENGKFTDAQMAEAIARDERYIKADALLEQMRIKREERLRQQVLAEDQPEKAKEILKAKDLVNIFGGEESDYTFEKKAREGDDARVVKLFEPGFARRVDELLPALQKLATDPAHKALIADLERLKLGTSISMVDRLLRDGGSAGLYNEIADHVLIGKGGATVETVLHEIVHPATIAKIDEGMAILTNVNAGRVKLKNLTPEQRRLAEAAQNLTDIYIDAMEREGSERHYGLESPKEFVAEALTNLKFQDFLRRGGAKESLWQRFVNMVKKALGLKTSDALLDRALSVSREFMASNESNRPLPDAADLPSLEKFMEGPLSAAKQTDTMIERIAHLGDRPLSIKQGFTRAHLFATTLNHIRQVYKQVLPEPYRTALDDFGNAKDRTKTMVEERNRTALEISRMMTKLADKQPGLDTKLYRLMGESTRHNIFPDRPIEQQHWKAKESTPEKIRKYNELRSLYLSNEDMRKAYDAAANYNKNDYDRIYATIVRNLARYSQMPKELWAKIDVTHGRSAEVHALEKWLLEKGDDEQRVAMRGALAQYREKQQGPYFHLGRNGSYFTRFTIKNDPLARAAYEKEFGLTPMESDRVVTPDDLHVFSRFEQADEWKAVSRKLDKLREAGHLESDMQSGQLETMIGGLDSSSPSFMRGLLRNIEADARLDPDQKKDAQDMIRRLAVEMLPETSASKAFAQRKGVAGYDVDMNRSFVKRSAATAYFVAHNSIRPEVEDALLMLKQGVNALQDASGPHYDSNKGLIAAAIQDEIKKRQANELSPIKTPIMDSVSALSHSFYLAANPAFLIMKTTQPWQITLPLLGAKHGYVRSFGAMTKATATALGIIKDTIGDGWQRDEWRGILDPDIVIDRSRATKTEKAFLKEMIAAGGATFTQAHDMGRIAVGEAQGISTTVKAANASMHYSEALDRMTAGLAAFNLEMKRTGGDFDKSTSYALQAVKNSLYDYNSHNRGRAFTKHGIAGPATPLLTQFAQYQFQTLELLGRLTMDSFGKVSPDMTPAERAAAVGQRAEARKALAGIMSTTMVLAGTMGLPAVSVIAAAYNALFSTPDSPADALTDYRNFLADTFGKEMGEVIAHGGLRTAGSDLGSRLGFQDILPFSRFLADRRQLQDKFDSGAMAMMGPAVGAVSGFAYGAQSMLQGRYMKGLEQMLPSGLKGVVKAAGLAEHGATDARGNKLPIEITSWDIFGQALNSTPAKLAEQREAQRGANTTNALIQMRSASLKENFAVATERGDGAEMKKLLDQITEFNKANPDYAVRNLTGILRQRAMSRAIAEETDVMGSARQLPRLMANQRFANTGGMP